MTESDKERIIEMIKNDDLSVITHEARKFERDVEFWELLEERGLLNKPKGEKSIQDLKDEDLDILLARDFGAMVTIAVFLTLVIFGVIWFDLI
jgi:hypothetical protein